MLQMITKEYELHVGDTIWDFKWCRWGEVTLIDDGDAPMRVNKQKQDVAVEYVCQEDGLMRTATNWIYPLVKGLTYKGEPVCLEMDGDLAEEYYSPSFNIDVWEDECDAER